MSPSVATGDQRRDDGRDAVAALAGSAAIAVVQLHVADHAFREPAGEELGCARGFGERRGLRVEHRRERRRADLAHQRDRLVERVDLVGLVARQRLEEIDHAGLLRGARRGGERLGDPRARGRAIDAGRRAPLCRRAVDEIAPAQRRAQVDDPADRVDRAGAHRGVRARDREPVGLHEQPVQPGDRDAGVGGRAAHVGDARGREGQRVVRERERRDLEAVVADRGREGALRGELALAQHLVAEREPHRGPAPAPRLNRRRERLRIHSKRNSTMQHDRGEQHRRDRPGDEGRQVAVGEHEPAAQVLLEQVAEHDAQHQRRHRIVELPQHEADQRRTPPSRRCRTGARRARTCRSCTARG